MAEPNTSGNWHTQTPGVGAQCPRCAELDAELADRVQRDSARLAEGVRLEADIRLMADKLAAAEQERDQARAAYRELMQLHQVKCGQVFRLAALEAAAQVIDSVIQQSDQGDPVVIGVYFVRGTAERFHAAVAALDEAAG